MVDINFGDSSKIKMRMFAYLAQREMAKEYPELKQKGIKVIDVVHADLRECTNYGIRKIYKNLMKSAKIMNEPHQTRVMADLGAFFLWVIYKDTAYRDPLFWMLDELKKDDKFWESIKQYVKPPEKWYCPIWHDTMENTDKGQKENKITKFGMSQDELTFVPQLQQNKWEKYSKEVEEEMKRRGLK